jgi:uncharacterized membrane protein YadS
VTAVQPVDAVRDVAACRPPDGAAPQRGHRRAPWSGLLAAAVGLGAALLAHHLVPAIGVLTWAVALGMVAGNTRLLPAAARPELGHVTRRLLRTGIVLLGFGVSFGAIAALGPGTVALVAGTLVATLVVTTWLGNRARLGRARSLLIGTGFAICGASAIAAMEETAGADEEDVAAAGAGGAAVVAVAVVVKLTRVLLLAPVVAAVSIRRRMADPDRHPAGKRPPLVPLFVLGFLACVAVRSTGLVPAGMLAVVEHLQVATLGAALFGMGAGVRLSSLVRGTGPVLLVATVSTLFIAGVSLAGVLLLGG